MAGASSQQPARKRVRFDHAASSDARAPGLDATECVQLRFIWPDTPLPASPTQPHPTHLTFVPPFLHQIIPHERVRGWQSLHVAVYVHVPTLTYWIDSEGQRDEHPDTDHTDVPALLALFIKDGLCPTRDDFEQIIIAQSPPLPFEHSLSEYSVADKRYVVYKHNFMKRDKSGATTQNAPLLAFHHRMAFLMFLYINDASFIDVEDERWELFVTACLDHDGRPAVFTAYSTVYPFSALAVGDGPMHFAERVRVSQVFVQPFFQRHGHGANLLNVIYADAKRRDAIQVTVEDPSPSFRLLRDITDLRRAYDAKILHTHAPLRLDDEQQLLHDLSQKLLLTPAQARRCLEVHQLRHTDRADDNAYKKYRLWVKRRLFNVNLEILDQYDKQEKKDRLAEIYDDLQTEYDKAILRLDARSTTKHTS
ncbi:Histone acetyltransferase type B catalytic subunit [Gracilariopsis chorda]|uniref:histone acetyltransferase n=1 Tax=Gracilariopsis chorda TaxID=448386 RepID=A0A2V3IN76_9FLOR|nr:Histone acetyltransferase type B catalytic subunit [Gracilariopsis chorda]|eukprot:PXF42570.1 Histone acetyltransferase type B catalytic subunit [Gracilariopsis chorda]